MIQSKPPALSSSEKNWKHWNELGLIPGEEESEEEYIKRVEFCLEIQNHLHEVVADLPFTTSDRAAEDLILQAKNTVFTLFGIAPIWIPLFFSNYRLAPWQAGCAWIFQLTESTPISAFLQIRSQFRTRSTYLGMYRRDELVSHELAHAARMMYNEPQFEEILAYQTSSSKWRRFFGPIVQSHKESLLFILLATLIIINHLLTITFNQDPVYYWSLWFEFGLLGFVAFFSLARLCRKQLLFHRCLKNLEKIYDAKTARRFIFRLRDTEIKRFASSTPEEIQSYRSSQKNFRWKFLNQLYSN